MQVRWTCWLVSGLTACALTLASAGQIRAETIDTTLSWNGTAAKNDFGTLLSSKGGIATIGQTFTTGATDTVLNGFTMDVNNPVHQGPVGSNPLTFQAYVMAWNGTQATGPVLYTSPSETAVAGAGMQAFTFNTSALQLNPNQQYVAFLSTSGLVNPTPSKGKVGTVGNNPYSGGQLVWLSNGDTFSGVTTQTWSTNAKRDAAFQANLSTAASPSVGAAPVPAGLPMALIGCGSLLGWSWRRRRPV